MFSPMGRKTRAPSGSYLPIRDIRGAGERGASGRMRRLRTKCHRCGEQIPASRHSLMIRRSASLRAWRTSLTHCASKSWLNDHVRPYRIEQFVFGNEAAGVCDQVTQNSKLSALSSISRFLFPYASRVGIESCSPFSKRRHLGQGFPVVHSSSPIPVHCISAQFQKDFFTQISGNFPSGALSYHPISTPGGLKTPFQPPESRHVTAKREMEREGWSVVTP